MRIKNSIVPVVLLALAGFALTGCSTKPIQHGDTIEEPLFSAERVLGEDVEADLISDPLEPFNRTMFRFNYHFDRYVFLPAVGAYQTVTPDVAEQGIHNFLENLRDLTTLINSVLQLSPDKTAATTGRMLVNTTVGVLGLIDVATMLEIPKHREDFGQTMGRWGVGMGPYLVLPVLGPSNIRDGTGTAVDWWVFNEIDPLDLDDHNHRAIVYSVVNALDLRANTAFRYYETGSPVEYELVRLLHTTMRKLEVER